MSPRPAPPTAFVVPAVGDALPPFAVPSVDAGRMATMAALLDDPVPIHYDVAAVRALGMGDRLVNQGPMSIGYLAELVVRWTGDPARLRRLRCRLHANVFEGDELVCTGVVTARDDDAGVCTVELAVRRGDEVVVSGAAEVATRPDAEDRA